MQSEERSVNELSPSGRAAPPRGGGTTAARRNAPSMTTAVVQTSSDDGDFIDLGSPGTWPERPSNQTLVGVAGPARLVDLSNPDSWPERPSAQRVHSAGAASFVDLSDSDAWPDRPPRKSEAVSGNTEVVPMSAKFGERPEVPMEPKENDGRPQRVVPMSPAEGRP